MQGKLFTRSVAQISAKRKPQKRCGHTVGLAVPTQQGLNAVAPDGWLPVASVTMSVMLLLHMSPACSVIMSLMVVPGRLPRLQIPLGPLVLSAVLLTLLCLLLPRLVGESRHK